MNTTVLADDTIQDKTNNPGSQLALIREQKGYSREYVAGKLHLRVRVIELLEEDRYEQMPEAVFVKGYLRAYAKLLGVAPEPYLALFNSNGEVERKTERVALWQGKRESNRNERAVRWVSGLIVISAIVAVSFWWQKNNEGQLFSSAKNNPSELKTAEQPEKEIEVKLTDITKMQSMFRTSTQSSVMEK